MRTMAALPEASLRVIGRPQPYDDVPMVTVVPQPPVSVSPCVYFFGCPAASRPTYTSSPSSFGWGLPITRKDASGSAAIVRIGDGNPDYKWGLTNNLSWKNVDVFTLVDAAVGGQAYNQTNQRMYQWAKSRDVDQVGKPQELKKPIEYYVALYAANNPTD